MTEKQTRSQMREIVRILCRAVLALGAERADLNPADERDLEEVAQVIGAPVTRRVFAPTAHSAAFVAVAAEGRVRVGRTVVTVHLCLTREATDEEKDRLKSANERSVAL